MTACTSTSPQFASAAPPSYVPSRYRPCATATSVAPPAGVRFASNPLCDEDGVGVSIGASAATVASAGAADVAAAVGGDVDAAVATVGKSRNVELHAASAGDGTTAEDDALAAGSAIATDPTSERACRCMAYNANKTMTDNDRTIFLTVSSMLIATGTPARPPGRRPSSRRADVVPRKSILNRVRELRDDGRTGRRRRGPGVGGLGNVNNTARRPVRLVVVEPRPRAISRTGKWLGVC